MAKKNRPSKYQVRSHQDEKPQKPQKPIHQSVSVSFMKITDDGCLSHCQKKEVRAFVKAMRILTTLTWMDVIETGGKPYGGKNSLGYTLRDDIKFPTVGEEIRISSLRAGDKERIFGFHDNQIYYILAFAPNHDL